MAENTPLTSVPHIESDAIHLAASGMRLQTLVYIRWLAVLGQALTVVIVYFVFGYDLPLLPIALLISASAILNLLVSLNRKPSARLPNRGAILYLFYDILQLAGLLYFTGGLSNPFSVLFLVPVTISATNLTRQGTFFLGLTTLACISVLALFYEPLPLPEGSLILSNTYILAIWAALVLGTAFLSGYAWLIAADSRKMSDALTIARAELAREQQLSAVGGIAAAAAHELGTPLNTILLVSEELRQALPEGSDSAEDAALLHDQAKKCAEVLAQLSKGPQTERFITDSAHHNFLSLDNLFSLIAEKYKDSDKSFAIQTHGDTADIPRLFLTAELRHGLGNLISNAAEFAASKVTIDLYWNDKLVRAEIRDDGPGFSEEILDRLGEPYMSTRRGRGGMGLGVFIANMLIKRSGGEVNFRNQKDSGAIVEILWSRRALEKSDPFSN
ncbi:ActS/PrrB/RegB family redox-sensitive histidine kinase [Sneathiella sp. HT1-7]|uniref:ActS/PrrB/RegB family redox-sensitive histidine kinase n=1 Tax=Sneathiella sp. HT1-7 TaxID=2887192 RepID=UPI001D15AB41|nr:ActS/PrrB/RegB family redox-sensitive histidine kinase [Sneathiella sp. HT1-7]MCC3303940.1 ActS/PrrB/RegB family redox-sensitive histidine kinase [Sneathiella sp. HT1-7]